MQWLLTLALWLTMTTTVHAVCSVAAGTGATLTRLGMETPATDECLWEQRLNNNFLAIDARACWSLAGYLDCGTAITNAVVISLDKITASHDLYEIFIAPRPATLLSAGCHCDANCTTAATLSFEGRSATPGSQAIDFTGGGNLTCSSSSGLTTYTTFSTSDTDRLLADGKGVRLNVTNTPTTDQRITLILKYTTP